MRLQIGQRIFAPSLVPTVLTLILLPVFIKLGIWQLHRADEKRALMQQAAQGRATTLPLNAANADQLHRYQHVQAQGVFDNVHQILLDNMPSATGQPGYHVWTPLKLTDGSTVLVDRGWVAYPASGAGAAAKSLPSLDVSQQPRMISGIVDELPRPGVRAGNAGIGSTWPQVLNYPRIEELRTLYGDALQSRIVLMDKDNADGFERLWKIDIGFTPQRHIAYAVQWFGFAIALAVIFVVVNLRPALENKPEQEQAHD
jgi:surfeit locus 1 family protein